MNPEKNDVDVSKLFNWGKVFIIESSEGQEEGVVFMKLLGDADVNRARVFALRKSAELRRKLMDLDSDERITLIRDFNDIEPQDIINYILIFSMREISNQAAREVNVPSPKMPKSNAKLEKLEKYQKEVDEYPEKRKEAINKYIKNEVDKIKEYLATESKETLYKKYVTLLVDEFCEREALRAYSDMEVYLGCFKDDDYKVKFFDSFEQYDNLDSRLKSQFREAYDKIGVGMDELKKLREATR